MGFELNKTNKPYFIGVWSNNAGLTADGVWSEKNAFDIFPNSASGYTRGLRGILSSNEMLYTDDSLDGGNVYKSNSDNTGDYNWDGNNWVSTNNGKYDKLNISDGYINNFQNKNKLFGVHYIDRRLDYEIVSVSPFRGYNYFNLRDTSTNEIISSFYDGKYYARLINGQMFNIKYVYENEDWSNYVILDNETSDNCVYGFLGAYFNSSNIKIVIEGDEDGSNDRYIKFSSNNINDIKDINDSSLDFLSGYDLAKEQFTEINNVKGQYPLFSYINYKGFDYGKYVCRVLAYDPYVTDTSDTETMEIKMTPSNQEDDYIENTFEYSNDDLTFDLGNNITCTNIESKINVQNGEYNLICKPTFSDYDWVDRVNSRCDYYQFIGNNATDLYNNYLNSGKSAIEICNKVVKGTKIIPNISNGKFNVSGNSTDEYVIIVAVFTYKAAEFDSSNDINFNTLKMTTKEVYYTNLCNVTQPVAENISFKYVYNTTEIPNQVSYDGKYITGLRISYDNNYFKQLYDYSSLYIINGSCNDIGDIPSGLTITKTSWEQDLSNLDNGVYNFRVLLKDGSGLVSSCDCEYSNDYKLLINNLPYDIYNCYYESDTIGLNALKDKYLVKPYPSATYNIESDAWDNEYNNVKSQVSNIRNPKIVLTTFDNMIVKYSLEEDGEKFDFNKDSIFTEDGEYVFWEELENGTYNKLFKVTMN